MIAKFEWTQSNSQQNVEQLQTPTIGLQATTNQHQQNPTLEWIAAKTTGGLNLFYWYQIFALNFAVVEAQL